MAVVLKRIMAKFDDFAAFERALGSLQTAGVPSYEAYGPINLEHIDHLMPREAVAREGALSRVVSVLTGRGGSPVRFYSTIGALVGMTVFYGLCVLTSLIFNLIVGGKPPVSNLPYVIPAYEGTILLGAIGAFIAVIYYARLIGSRSMPHQYDPRFSGDRFGIDVSCEQDKVASVTELLKNAGAVEVYEY